MAGKTKIEWTGNTWNPTTGCDQISAGCDNCYALSLSARLKAMGSPRYQNNGNPTTSGPGFALTMHTDNVFYQPLRWTKPRHIFVNSMSDLFHAHVTREYLGRVFAIMALTPAHTYQVLTKRPERMRRILTSPDFPAHVHNGITYVHQHFNATIAPAALQAAIHHASTPTNNIFTPLPNVWLGTSVEDQKTVPRVTHLAATPAALWFLSCEPLIGPVDLTNQLAPIDWVIVGGESGPRARLMQPQWATQLRDQCAGANVAYFFKQAGDRLAHQWGLKGKGADPGEWPIPLPRQFPT